MVRDDYGAPMAEGVRFGAAQGTWDVQAVWRGAMTTHYEIQPGDVDPIEPVHPRAVDIPLRNSALRGLLRGLTSMHAVLVNVFVEPTAEGGKRYTWFWQITATGEVE
jgi:hypothetical protein